jgi:hypothetical protein
MLYCLEVQRAYPDYKRPYASVNVYHFKTIDEADNKRREEKKRYYESFCEFLEETGEDVPTDVDKIDEDEAQNYFYSESYMDMAPFSATLYEIQFDDDTVTSKRISFPNLKIDSSSE